MIFAVLGSLGGVVAFLGAIAVIVRSISRQVSATESNTKALNELKDTVVKLDSTVDDQNVRLVRVEERAERTGGRLDRVESRPPWRKLRPLAGSFRWSARQIPRPTHYPCTWRDSQPSRRARRLSC